jgi:hypothetical protein
MDPEASMTDDRSSGPESDDKGSKEDAQIRRDIALLLDFLEQLADNRLFAQFKDTRVNAAENPPSTNTPADFVGNPPSIARPPCANYADFLNRLATINRDGPVKDEPFGSRDGDPKLDDLSFLRWSRNFLAAIAAPATVRSIKITDEFLRARGHYIPYLIRIRRAANWLRQMPRASKQAAGSYRLRLPRSVVRLEIGLIGITLLTVVISAYAMVGKYISDQRADALNGFSSIVHDVDADSVLIPRPSHDGNIAPIQADFWERCAGYGGGPADRKVAVSDAPGTDIERTAVQATLKLVQDCRQLEWAAKRLVGETIRMRSWEKLFIGGPNGSLSERIGAVLAPFVGWSYDAVSRSSGQVDSVFCRTVASGSQPAQPSGCAQVVFDLVTDTGSTASSILGWITLFLVPSLYSLIGAGAATMLALRRKVDTWTLILSDRNRIAYNMILGSAFGAIIGMFSRSFGSETSIGPAAIALLAGFNVPGVFSFLDQFSKQVFRLGETPQSTK